jgi:HK97 family phage prohead protease
MLYKAQSTQIKDLADGIVTAYANAYNNEDSDGDISVPGSFKRTVEHQARKIRVFKDHDRYTVLGVPIELDASDPVGLLTRTQFNMEKEVSRDMFTDIKLMMEHGQDADLSVGVIPVKRDEQDKRKVTEWKLKEYSFLSSWGANEMATVQQIKSGKPVEEIVALITKAYDMDYSDTRLREIEKILKSLEPGNSHFDPTNDKGLDKDHSFESLLTQLETKL